MHDSFSLPRNLQSIRSVAAIGCGDGGDSRPESD
jgi:hypothetical protein